jgi:hypothetical protein
VLLTKDKDIRRRPLEIEAILNTRVRAFVLTATELRREEQSAIFLRAMPEDSPDLQAHWTVHFQHHTDMLFRRNLEARSQ